MLPLVNIEQKKPKAPRFLRMTPALSALVAASLLLTSFVAGYAAGSVDPFARDKHERKAKKRELREKWGEEEKRKKGKKKKKRDREGEAAPFDALLRFRGAPASGGGEGLPTTQSPNLPEGPRADAIDVSPPPAGELRFTGACDASGAVPIDRDTFALVDDEDNVIRVYDARLGGAPTRELDLSPALPQKPEADLEAATRAGNEAYFLSSHGRSKKGVIKEERIVFFSTNIPEAGQELKVIGAPYRGLVQALARDERFAPFGLQKAAELAPTAPGGINIEGMTASPTGSLLIGFRNPIPQNQALLVELMNPGQIPWGAAPKFSAPITLSLKGRGVRALSWWHGEYLIAAGPRDVGASQLYRWGGPGTEPAPVDLDLGGLNPEAFFTPEEREEFLVISDDGATLVGGVECKKLKDKEMKGFRARWVRFEEKSAK
jgi:hypothetical protein